MADLLKNIELVKNVDFSTFSKNPELLSSELINLKDSKSPALKPHADDLKKDTLNVAQKYLEFSKNAYDLNNGISQFKSVLNNLEQNITTFQDILSLVQKDVLKIQTDSAQLKCELKNSESKQQKINAFMRSLVIDNDLIKDICSDKIDTNYAKAVDQLSDKLDCVVNDSLIKSLEVKNLLAALHGLKQEAICKIAPFIFNKIKIFEREDVNVQVFQSKLIPYKSLFLFVKKHSFDVAEQLEKSYIDVIKKKYTSILQSYMDVLKLNRLNKTFYSVVTRNSEVTESVFDLAGRELIISNFEPEDAQLVRFWPKKGFDFFEALFVRINAILLSLVTYEKEFLEGFFSSAIMFRAIFGDIFQFLETYYSKTLLCQWDVFEVLICIRINQRNHLLMRRIGLDCVDFYFNQLNSSFWRRAGCILNKHLAGLHSLAREPLSIINSEDRIVPRFCKFIEALIKLNIGYDDFILVNFVDGFFKEFDSVLDGLGIVDKINVWASIKNKIEIAFFDNEGKVLFKAIGSISEILKKHFEYFLKEEKGCDNLVESINQPVDDKTGKGLDRSFYDKQKKCLSKLLSDINQTFPLLLKEGFAQEILRGRITEEMKKKQDEFQEVECFEAEFECLLKEVNF